MIVLLKMQKNKSSFFNKNLFNSLGNRFTTSVVLFLFLYIFFNVDFFLFKIFLTILSFVAFFEWIAFLNKSFWFNILYVMISIFSYYIFALMPTKITIIILFIHWLWILKVIYTYQSTRIFFNYNIFAHMISGIAIILPIQHAMICLYYQSMLATPFVIVVSFDTAGYFIGSAFQGKKIIPKISPNKTLSGFLGGLIISTILGFIMILNSLRSTDSRIYLFFVVFSTACLAFIGDSFESLIKRVFKCKDSGNIFPGHGGILDRIDSFFFSFPYFCLLLNFFSQA